MNLQVIVLLQHPEPCYSDGGHEYDDGGDSDDDFGLDDHDHGGHDRHDVHDDDYDSDYDDGDANDDENEDGAVDDAFDDEDHNDDDDDDADDDGDDDEMKMKQCIAIHNILLILFVRGKATAHGHSCIRKLVSQDGSDCSTVTSFPATLITKSLVTW